MRASLGIRGRLSLAILLTAIIPLAGAVVFARSMVQQASARYFVPEVRQNLEQALELYDELAKVTKARMRSSAELIAADPALLAAARRGDRAGLAVHLKRWVGTSDDLVKLVVQDALGEPLAEARRERPLDPARELSLLVVRPLAGPVPTPTPGAIPLASEESGPAPHDAGVALHPEAGLRSPAQPSVAPLGAPQAPTGEPRAGEPGAFELEVTLATPKDQFESFANMGEFIDAYSKLEERREADERTYVTAFATLLGIAIALAVLVGTLLARGVTRRVSELAIATRQVATGDLSIRVHEESADEIGDLGRAFNRMLAEVESSRDRIEYLSRLASWQEMARRLAHEIKNPLTPIQLAVQEVHQRLAGLSPEQRSLLDTALEIVEAEVQTLRRLVSEFSEFARLPESHLQASDLFEFLREFEQETQLSKVFTNDRPSEGLVLEFRVPQADAPALLDRQLMRRVFINLVQNAVQASRGRAAPVRVEVSARRASGFYEVLLDDDGPGVSQALRSKVFEPYVTDKDDGTGLGLAIVKKIVIEHRGHIEMLESPAGGARVRMLLPIGSDRSSALPESPTVHQ